MITFPVTAFTHAGRFHSDDVFSAALLKILNPSIQIQRGFHVPQNFTGLVFDIGFGPFDHHQKLAPIRDNGIPYASFGLLWRQYGAELVGADEAERFDLHFVQPLDLDDNTGCGSEIASIISSFNPGWDSDESADLCFTQVVNFAQTILQKKIDSIHSFQRARVIAEDALSHAENGIVILPRFAPWKMVLVPSPAEFVIYPSQRGGFSAQAVPQDDEAHTLKIPFPAAWAGASESDLVTLSGLATLRFCHNSYFLIATDTLEDAISACKIARSQFH